MQVILIIVASLVPGFLWIWFFRSKDLYEREPWTMLFRAFVFGAIAVGPAAIAELPFRPILDQGLGGRLFVSFLVIGLAEELFKFIALYLAIFRSEEFNEVVDGIIYGVTVAIGFSVVENVLYTATFGLQIAPIRAVIATLAHASFTGLMGWYVGQARFSDDRKALLLKGLVIAIFLHGLYDFLLLARFGSPLIALAMVGVLYYVLRRKIDEALLLSPFRKRPKE